MDAAPPHQADLLGGPEQGHLGCSVLPTCGWVSAGSGGSLAARREAEKTPVSQLAASALLTVSFMPLSLPQFNPVDSACDLRNCETEGGKLSEDAKPGLVPSPMRLTGVDAARWLLCFPVAFLHSMPRPDSGAPPTVAVLIAIACRGAVPFFFVASGYFASSRHSLAPFKRLAPVYVAWLLIYSIADYNLWQLLRPGTWATGGTALHLWFLPALIVAVTAIPASVDHWGAKITGALCILAAGCGVSFDAYRLVIDMPVIGGTRLMTAPLLVYCGIMIRRIGLSVPPISALLVFAFACALAFGEEALIARLAHAPIVSHAAVAATFLMGPALFLCAKGIGQAPSWMSRLGAISLGVYAAHLLFVWLLLPAFGNGGVIQQIAIGIAAVLAATFTSMLLSHSAATSWLVEPQRQLHLR
jgi:surface polysaccharide O-acyltransferase-like enzyme